MNTRQLIVLVVFLSSLVAVADTEKVPLNQLPMYGSGNKSRFEKEADAQLLKSIEQQGLSKKEGAKNLARRGWYFFAQRDFKTAMARFNQAWLLDPENGDVYHGFAVISSEKQSPTKEVEKLFLLSVSKPQVDATAFVDYGRFLRTEKRFDEALTQLNKALELSASVRNARANISFVYYLKNDFAKACDWAKKAKDNKDELEKGYLEDMCERAKADAK